LVKKAKENKYMAVSISRIRKDIEEIKKTLGERIIYYPDNAVAITCRVNEIISLYSSSELLYLHEPGIAEMDMDRLTEVLKDAKKLNFEYENFLKMVGLERIN
jgi:hypothetical protein